MTAFLYATVITSVPLILATLGEIITEKAGHLNLGVEGMMLLGAVAGFGVGLYSQNPLLAVFAAMAAGASGAFLYALLTVSLRANQVVSGLALTMFGTGMAAYIGTAFVGQKLPEQIITSFEPVSLPGLSRIPIVGRLLFQHDWLIYLTFCLIILMSIYLHHTRIGLNLQAIGDNPAAADASGISITAYKYAHILLGGALCGLGGAYLSIVEVPQWQENITAGRGWIAIALVIFCRWDPWKTFGGALFFGGLSIVGFRLQNSFISKDIFDALPYLVTILVLVIGSFRRQRLSGQPQSLSLPYFREER